MITVSSALRESLAARPVLAQGQADDLVIEAKVGAVRRSVRVWLSRVDGTVSVEAQGFDGSWYTCEPEDERVYMRAALLETLGTEWEGGIW